MGFSRKLQGGLAIGMAALFMSASLAAAPELPLLTADLRVFKPTCTDVHPDTVSDAVKGASLLLETRCRLRLRRSTLKALGLNSGWCDLPQGAKPRSAAIRALSAKAKAEHPHELALFLLPTRDTESRYSWAFVDESRRAACDSPQEARYLPRFGSLFFTDLTWAVGDDAPEKGAPTRSSLLLAHEVLHSLTHRGHPSGAKRGSIMADHVADMGPALTDDWCACARQSPYLRALKP